MSYYESNYYRNPGPVYGPGGDWGEPVPGWGVLPNMAGPQCVGIGQPMLAPSSGGTLPVTQAMDPRVRDVEQKSGIAWWWWVVGGLALGAGVGIAHNKGLLRKLPFVGRSFR